MTEQCHVCTSTLAPLKRCACGEKLCSMQRDPGGPKSCFELHQQADCAGRMAPRRAPHAMFETPKNVIRCRLCSSYSFSMKQCSCEESFCYVRSAAHPESPSCLELHAKHFKHDPDDDEVPDTDCPSCNQTLVFSDEMDAMAEHGLCFLCAYEALDKANERISELEAQLKGEAPGPDIAPARTWEDDANEMTVDLIERLLAKARSGEVQDVIMVATLADGSIATECTPSVNFVKRLGAIEHAKLRWYHEHMLEGDVHDAE